MAFGLNKVQIIGRLGADVTVNALNSGGRVANMSVATDESYMDRARPGAGWTGRNGIGSSPFRTV